MWIYL